MIAPYVIFLKILLTEFLEGLLEGLVEELVEGLLQRGRQEIIDVVEVEINSGQSQPQLQV